MRSALVGAWLVSVVVVFSCSSADQSTADRMPAETPVTYGSGGGMSVAPPDTTAAAGASSGSAGAMGAAGATSATPPASGQGSMPSLTAGMWDDNANYDVFLKYTLTGAQNYASSLPGFDLQTTDAAHTASLQRGAFDAIDIALVLDATGSMSDELTYLQNEFLGISNAVVQRFPTTNVRWSLTVYRDVGDEYVTRSFDFTNVVGTFQQTLAAQSSSGGGDTPEAVPEALQAALGKTWRGPSAAQMLFWVADAPHHDAATAVMRAALVSARSKGIRIYPVAASNANPLAEATMRVGAQLTGGRYIFLTDDSGVGGGHSEPKVPCYYVTKFNDAIVRSVAMELTGQYVAPAANSIVRIVGNPIGDTCAQAVTLDGGSDTGVVVPEAAPEIDAQGVPEIDAPSGD